MDQFVARIATLEKELTSKEEDLVLSATIGKQLLQDCNQLNAQIEEIKQEKHSLQLSLDSKIQTIKNQASEIDSQKDFYDTYVQQNEQLKKENCQVNKKFQDKNKENEELKKSLEETFVNNDKYTKKISLLEDELKEFQNQIHLSLNETNSEEQHKLQSELDICQNEKKDLVALTSEMQYNLDQAKARENQLTNLIGSLQEEIQEKDQELQAYSIIVEKSKDEVTELMAEIELLKFQQFDVNRRGNSVFGEVEDRRKAVERELFILRGKHKSIKEKYEINLNQHEKLKHQMAIVLGMISQKIDYGYMEELENNLISAKSEIAYLTNCLADQMKVHHSMSPTPADVTPAEDGYNYLRAMLLQSQQKVETLEKELQSQRMLKLADNDKLIQTQRLLYHSEKRAENFRGEVLKLKLKLQDFIHVTAEESVERAPNIEIIPGFKIMNTKENKVDNLPVIPISKENLLTENIENKENKALDVSADQNISTVPGMMRYGCTDPHDMLQAVLKKKVSFSSSGPMDRSKNIEKSNMDSKRKQGSRNVTAPTLHMPKQSNCAQQ